MSPVGVQTFGSELAVEAFDEGVVGRFAGPGEVEHDVLLVGPQIEITADELAALIDPDRLRVAHLSTNPFEGLDHVFATIIEARINRRRKAREGVDDGQDTDLPASRQLVMHEVHGPGLIAAHSHRTVFSELGLHPPPRRLVSQL